MDEKQEIKLQWPYHFGPAETSIAELKIRVLAIIMANVFLIWLGGHLMA
jgi:hypothetical protein